MNLKALLDKRSLNQIILNMRITIIFVLLALLLFSHPYPAFANKEDIGYSTISPASPFYFLKGVREYLELKFAGTYHIKMLRQLEFAKRRLRETRTLLTIDQELIVPTLERYIAHMNRVTDKHLPNAEFVMQIQDDLAVHLAALERIYAQADNPRAKMAIRSAMNRIIQREDVANEAKLPVCEIFLKEASSSALNQTEQVVLQNRAQKCLKIKK